MLKRNVKFYIALLVVFGFLVIIAQNFEESSINNPTSEKQETLVNNRLIEEDVSSKELPRQVNLSVPFSPQAPFANWDDPRQQDGCEEASITMAAFWLNDKKLSRQIALDEILKLSALAESKFGTFRDASAVDTLNLMQEYFNYEKGRIAYSFEVADIKKELAAGNLIIIPADGQKLNNPNFSGEGPPRHMLVIRGYDEVKKQFITNDPGTRQGEGYRYDYQIILNSILNYETGYHEPVLDKRNVMIVIEK